MGDHGARGGQVDGTADDRCGNGGATIAQALSIDAMDPVLRVTRTFLDAGNRPVLLTQAHYRADRYQIRLDLQSGDLGEER